MKNNPKILLVEDDESFGGVLKAFLELNGYFVRWIMDGKHAVAAFRECDFDLCVLDIMLPNIDGFCIAKDIKVINDKIPFIFLTAKSLREDVISGFKIGAQDYITKPFDTEVLLFKIKAILSRNKSNEEPENQIIRIGDFELLVSERLLRSNSLMKRLSPKESQLLMLLSEYRNNILTRECALNRIWGDNNYFTVRSMDVYIAKLRKYLQSDPSTEIINVHGSGYKLICK